MRSGQIAGLVALAGLASGCLDDGVPDLRTAPVSVALDEIVAGSAPTAPRAEEPLPGCPIDEFDELIDSAVDLVDDPPVLAAIEGGPVAIVTTTGDSYPATVSCALAAAEGVASIDVSAAPDDLDAHLTALQDRFGAPFEVDESVLFRGGRFQRICSVSDDDGDTPGREPTERCAVVWIDDRVMIGLSVTGPEAEGINLDQLEERYSYVLPLIVERFRTS